MTYPTGAPSVQECLASVIVKEKPLRTTVPPTFIPIPPCRSWDSGTPFAFRSPISSKIPITRAPVWRASAAASAAWSKWSCVRSRNSAFFTSSGPEGAVGFPWNHGSIRTVLPEGSWREKPEWPNQRILTGGIGNLLSERVRMGRPFPPLYKALRRPVKREMTPFSSPPPPRPPKKKNKKQTSQQNGGKGEKK